MESENLWIIGYGLAGGFGGIRSYEVVEATNEEDASNKAWEMACEEYESYSGSNGLRSIYDIMEEDGLDEDEATEEFEQERESWLDYTAQPFSKELEEKYKSFHWSNHYSKITDKL